MIYFLTYNSNSSINHTLRLGTDKNSLEQLTIVELRSAITERRKQIRNHRDQKGDDRCWIDDYQVWTMLDDTPPEPTEPLPFDEAMKCCQDFYVWRRSETVDAVPSDAILDPLHWNNDLLKISDEDLKIELLAIQQAIKVH